MSAWWLAPVVVCALVYLAVWREDRAYQQGLRRGRGTPRRIW